MGVVNNETHTGDVTGATALTIADEAVTLAKMADIATETFIGRDTAGTGVPEALTIAQVQDLLRPTGTSFPGSPSEGEGFYRTDLDHWFYYDSSRSKWLGDALYSYQGTFLGTRTNDYTYLDANQLSYSATIGHVAPVDLCIVSASIVCAVNSTCTFQLRDDDTSVATIALSSSAVGSDNTLNSNLIAGGSIISHYVSGTATGGHVCVFHARRTAT